MPSISPKGGCHPHRPLRLYAVQVALAAGGQIAASRQHQRRLLDADLQHADGAAAGQQRSRLRIGPHPHQHRGTETVGGLPGHAADGDHRTGQRPRPHGQGHRLAGAQGGRVTFLHLQLDHGAGRVGDGEQPLVAGDAASGDGERGLDRQHHAADRAGDGEGRDARLVALQRHLQAGDR